MGMTVYHKTKLINLLKQGLKVISYNERLQKTLNFDPCKLCLPAHNIKKNNYQYDHAKKWEHLIFQSLWKRSSNSWRPGRSSVRHNHNTVVEYTSICSSVRYFVFGFWRSGFVFDDFCLSFRLRRDPFKKVKDIKLFG